MSTKLYSNSCGSILSQHQRVYNFSVPTRDFYLTLSALHLLLNFCQSPFAVVWRMCSSSIPWSWIHSNMDRGGPSEIYIPRPFHVDFPLPSLFPPPSRCLHPVTLRCLVLGFHQRVPREAASWNPFPICCSNIPQISLCKGFLKIFNCPAITYHLRNRDKVVSFSSS